MKILVILASGIGNTVLFTPTLICLRKHFPDSKIDLFSHKNAFTEPIRNSDLVNKIYIFKGLKTLLTLRKNRYNLSITAFPSNKWQFNLFAYIAGAKKRLTHSYKMNRLKTLSFFQNEKMSVDEKIHDVEQNMNLLQSLGIDISAEPRELLFYTDQEDDQFANQWLSDKKISSDDFIIGIHSGCNKENKFKRWPEQHFVELIKRLSTENKRVLIFSGPDEKQETQSIYDQSKNKNVFLLQDLSLKRTASIIAHCDIFINTDSGLGHIATAKKVETIALLGPAQLSRIRPFGKYGHYINLNLPCSPCMQYPFETTHSKIECHHSLKCLKKITPDQVINKINELKGAK